MNNVVTCVTPRCRAIFDLTVQWFYGWRDPDRTDDHFCASGRIPLGNCPICRKPQVSSTHQQDAAK